MTTYALWRVSAKSLARLCASATEGAQATEERQDKRDSLRLGPAVGLPLHVKGIAQAAVLARSLSSCTSVCSKSRIFTSSVCAHVW